MTGRAEVYARDSATHGEGPFWDDRRQRLLQVDMLAGDVLDLADPDAPVRHHVGTVAAVVRARSRGGFIVAIEHGFAFTDDDLVVQEVTAPVIAAESIRFNDGGCDPAGRFYCGSMAYDERPGAGSLYRLDADHRVDRVLDDVTISNGLQFSGDGTRAFYIDTTSGRIDVFDVESGDFRGRRPFAFVDPPGMPDGMAIDTDGGLWVALWGGSAVIHLDAAGTLVETVPLPVPKVTACAFGGAKHRTLFITTSRLATDPEDDPAQLAGSVFAVETDVVGATPHAYAG